MTADAQSISGGEIFSSSRVLKNSIFILASQGIQFLSSFFIIIAIARYLSVEQYGEYSFLTAFVSSVMALSYFGIQQVLIREIAKDKKSAAQYIGMAVQLRMSLSIAAVVIMAAYFILTKHSPIIMIAGMTAIVSEFFLSFSMLFKSVFQGFEKMAYEPLFTLIYCVVLSLGMVSVIYFDMGFLWLFIVIAFTNLVQLIAASYVMDRFFITPSFEREPGMFRQFFKNAVVIGVGIFFIRIFSA